MWQRPKARCWHAASLSLSATARASWSPAPTHQVRCPQPGVFILWSVRCYVRHQAQAVLPVSSSAGSRPQRHKQGA